MCENVNSAVSRHWPGASDVFFSYPFSITDILDNLGQMFSAFVHKKMEASFGCLHNLCHSQNPCSAAAKLLTLNCSVFCEGAHRRGSGSFQKESIFDAEGDAEKTIPDSQMASGQRDRVRT